MPGYRFTHVTKLLSRIVLAACFMLMLQATAQSAAYKIAAGDVLSVSVYGDAGLTGVFSVSGDGTIGYPILGNVSVAGKTIEEVNALLDSGLKAHIPNLSVAVTIKEYAPVFIMGDVQKPGKYEFRPGMVALELFALGGGLRESMTQTDSSGMQLIVAQQDYDDMSLQLLALDVKRVRLEAEFDDKPFNYTVAEKSAIRDPSNLASIVEAERKLYQLRLAVMQNERNNLEDQRQNYSEEIDMLEKSTAMRNEQFDLMKLDVDASQGLVNRGAASESALRERKRELLAMNQQLLEFGSYLARAKQNKNEMERRLQELDSKRKNDAATELREVNLDMMRLRKKLDYSAQMMAEISASARRVTGRAQVIKTEFTVVRMTNGQYSEATIDELTELQAGDMIRVRLVPPAEVMTVGSVN